MATSKGTLILDPRPPSGPVGGITAKHVEVDGETLPNAAEPLPQSPFDGARSNGDEADSRMSQIKEILGYAVMPTLEKYELVAEWVRHAEAKVSGQVVQKPKGGRPEGGVARAARELPVPGKTQEARRKFIDRAIKINTIWPEAKAEARTAGLDDNQSALRDIAKERSLDAQIAKVQEIAARKAMPRRKSSTTANNKSASSLTEVERLNAELAAAVERQRELEEELETARTTAERRSGVEGSVKAPTTNEDIPAALDRRPLGLDDQVKFDVAMTAWESDTELRASLISASPIVLERFIAAVREDIASASSPPT